MAEKGTLFVVATPIGNLADTTLRAIQVLKEVDLILSEDTRETQKLLAKFDIPTKQLSYRDENHTRVLNNILDLLAQGSQLALVSDSGTPLISDPGFKLVRDVIAAGFEVKAVPGASAVTAALSISGLPTDNFSFLGFLPKNGGPRTKLLEKFGVLPATLVIYESPFRVQKLLTEIKEVLGNRYVSICRELTKLHEECTRGFVEDLLAQKLTQKGEFTILIAKEGYSPHG